MVNTRKRRLFIDMDGTIVIWRAAKSEEDLVSKGFFANVGAYESVLQAVKLIHNTRPDIELYIASAVLFENPYAVDEKNEWLDKNLPEIDIRHRIFTTTGKSKAEPLMELFDFDEEVDVLLDDYSVNLHDWVAHKGYAIKLMNGINGTNGSWCGPSVYAFDTPELIASSILHYIDEI